MFASFIITFREILEVAVILSVVLAATTGLTGRAVWIWLGLILGIVGSGILALFTEAISMFAEGVGQELFNASILFIASGLIGWTAIWMGTHAKQMMANIRHKGSKIVEGEMPKIALTAIIALAVLREGSEIVLFTYGMLASGSALSTILLGSVSGMLVGSIVGLLIYFGIVTIPTKYVFKVTTWLLLLLAAGMSSVGAKYLVSAGYFSDLSYVVFDLSWLLTEQSLVGQILHAMFGYSEHPMVIQIIFYLLTLGIFFAILVGLKYMHNAKKCAETTATS